MRLQQFPAFPRELHRIKEPEQALFAMDGLGVLVGSSRSPERPVGSHKKHIGLSDPELIPILQDKGLGMKESHHWH
jgi:hypothetical protein